MRRNKRCTFYCVHLAPNILPASRMFSCYIYSLTCTFAYLFPTQPILFAHTYGVDDQELGRAPRVVGVPSPPGRSLAPAACILHSCPCSAHACGPQEGWAASSARRPHRHRHRHRHLALHVLRQLHARTLLISAYYWATARSS